MTPATFRFVAQRLNHCATAAPINTAININNNVNLNLRNNTKININMRTHVSTVYNTRKQSELK